MRGTLASQPLRQKDYHRALAAIEAEKERDIRTYVLRIRKELFERIRAALERPLPESRRPELYGSLANFQREAQEMAACIAFVAEHMSPHEHRWTDICPSIHYMIPDSDGRNDDLVQISESHRQAFNDLNRQRLKIVMQNIEAGLPVRLSEKECEYLFSGVGNLIDLSKPLIQNVLSYDSRTGAVAPMVVEYHESRVDDLSRFAPSDDDEFDAEKESHFSVSVLTQYDDGHGHECHGIQDIFFHVPKDKWGAWEGLWSDGFAEAKRQFKMSGEGEPPREGESFRLEECGDNITVKLPFVRMNGQLIIFSKPPALPVRHSCVLPSRRIVNEGEPLKEHSLYSLCAPLKRRVM